MWPAVVSSAILKMPVVEEFQKDFYAAYNKYFGGKPYLKKRGEEWSVVVGFAKRWFPESAVKYTQPFLIVKLDVDMLYEFAAKEIITEKLRDREGGYLVSRYLTQEGRKSPEINDRVNELVIQFFNDVANI